MIIPKTITFSGLDGSGKSTIIHLVKRRLEEQGIQTKVYTMYDDLSFYALLRKVRNRSNGYDDKSDDKIELENNSILYKIVRSKLLKSLVLPLDTLSILYFLFFKTSRKDIVLLDRASYDYILDILPTNFSKPLVKLAILFSFKPLLAVFVNTPAIISFDRKGEYDVKYLSWREEGYFNIFKLIKSSIILDNNSNTAEHNASVIVDYIIKKEK